ncbi:MAG: type II secretion system F family protein, partial [Clostridiales Family XIII bacterium]|nr:type II secretion system F family protein [Clostridiales Family XIII bacterium]
MKKRSNDIGGGCVEERRKSGSDGVEECRKSDNRMVARVRGFWDSLTGSRRRMEALCKNATLDMDYITYISVTKKNNSILLISAAAVLVIVVILEITGRAGGAEAPDLSRGAPGEDSKNLKLKVTAEYKDAKASEDAVVRILPGTLGEEETEEALEDLAETLPGLVLAGNADAESISSDLYMPETDPSTGADISWSSSDESIVAEDGKVNIVGAEEGTEIVLDAHIRLGSKTKDVAMTLVTGSLPDGTDTSKMLETRALEAAESVSRGGDGNAVDLPGEWKGVKLSWSQPSSGSMIPFALAAAAFFFIVYKCRFRAIEKRIGIARDEIEREFPNFLGKLSLLLGAGLTITSAIERIADGYEAVRERTGRKILYEELASVRDRMKASGTPLTAEFAEMAKKSGLKEVLRFSSVLADNIDKGSVLAEKLDAERELLWETRKKDAEKRGRVAETKLVFPMALQLFAVIVVTVAPTALEM